MGDGLKRAADAARSTRKSFRYTPAENGCFIAYQGGERIGWILPSGRGFRAHDNFMVSLRGVFKTRTNAAEALLRRFKAEEPDFHCHVCGADTDIAPNWPERAVCPAHCPDHMYEYERGEQTHRCRTCGQQAPDDWYEVD